MSEITDKTEIALLNDEKTLYFNGFAVAIGLGDVIVTLTRNGRPALTLNASYSVAKTFGAALLSSVKKFEEASNHQIMTVGEINKAMEKVGGKASQTEESVDVSN